MDWTWDLSVYYKGFDDPQIKADLEALKAIPVCGMSLIDAGDAPVKTLEGYVALHEKTSALMERLGSFGSLSMAVNATNEDAAKLLDTVMNISVDIELMQSAVTRYIGGIADLDAVIAQSDCLKSVAFALKKLKLKADHLLDEKVEPWMLKMSLTGGEEFSKLRDMLDGTLTVDYDGKELPLAAVRAMAYDHDPAVRKAAYEAELKAYKKIELPMAACLNGIKGETLTMAEAKGYDSVLQMTLDENDMKKETLDAMLEAIKEALPAFRAYLRKKGEFLGHGDGIPFYDLFAPVAVKGSKLKNYTVDEAHDLLIKEMGKFSPEMAQFIDHAFNNRWIDMFPREGKGGGAFCSGYHSARQSRVLTNFAGSASDVSTLAHELGHAWHNVQLDPLPYMMTNTSMQLAETASIFNETLLAQSLRHGASKQELLTLLEGELMESTQVVVDIYSRYLFEFAVIETRKDHSLSVNELKAMMLNAQEKAYGDGLDANARHEYMWACKSHYYSPGLAFYNFPYAFGMLFGKGIFAQYLKKGAAFVPEYNELLSLCGSDTVENVAKHAGIDVTDINFWRSSLKMVTDDIDTFIRLADELK